MWFPIVVTIAVLVMIFKPIGNVGTSDVFAGAEILVFAFRLLWLIPALIVWCIYLAMS